MIDWPKDPIRELVALADEQKRGLSANDRTMILIYERAMKEAYAARLRVAVEALHRIKRDRSGVHGNTAEEALGEIGEVPA